MATSVATLLTFSASIESSIPRDVQRHLQLIYGKLVSQAQDLASLPKSTGPQAVDVTTHFPKLESSIPRDVQRHLQLIYGAINNHGIAFTQLPKLNSNATVNPPSGTQTFSASIETTIPHAVQRHLQLIYGKLDNHAQALDLYHANSPTAAKS